MKMVLEERGVSTVGKTAEWMRKTLGEHSDFRDEKSMMELMHIEKGHIPCFLPKFHAELNPIERVWAQLKRFTKAHCKYSLLHCAKIFLSRTTLLVWKTFKITFVRCDTMFCYLEGFMPGKELDQTLVKYKYAVKSHRRISINE